MLPTKWGAESRSLVRRACHLQERTRQSRLYLSESYSLSQIGRGTKIKDSHCEVALGPPFPGGHVFCRFISLAITGANGLVLNVPHL